MTTTRIGAWVAAAVAVAAGAGPAAADAKPDSAAVAKAWAARQDKVKSFAVEWTEETVVPRGRVSRNRPVGSPDSPTDVPPRDFSYTSPRTLLMDGDKARLRYLLQHWWVSLNGPLTAEYDASFDGKTYTAATAYTPAGVTPPTGAIKRLDYHDDLSVPSSRPFMVVFRGGHPKYRVYNPAEYEATGRVVKVNGVACAELVRENRAQAFRSVLLVDPAREYLLVRTTWHERDKLSYQLDITYTADPVAGWVPATWEYLTNDPSGALFGSGRCKVTRCQINPELDATAMTCVPAPGTMMFDVTGPEQKKYVVQPDGSAGKKFHRSASITYEQLSVAGPDDSGRWWLRGPWLACAAAFAGSVGLLGWRTVARARVRRAAA